MTESVCENMSNNMRLEQRRVSFVIFRIHMMTSPKCVIVFNLSSKSVSTGQT